MAANPSGAPDAQQNCAHCAQCRNEDSRREFEASNREEDTDTEEPPETLDPRGRKRRTDQFSRSPSHDRRRGAPGEQRRGDSPAQSERGSPASPDYDPSSPDSDPPGPGEAQAESDSDTYTSGCSDHEDSRQEKELRRLVAINNRGTEWTETARHDALCLLIPYHAEARARA